MNKNSNNIMSVREISRCLVVLPLFVCGMGASASILFADTAEQIPLDRQVDKKLPQKQDPLYPKTVPEKPKPKIVKKTISYNGVWLVNGTTDSCKNKINSFKVRISGKDISTIVGMNLEGTIQGDGEFEMSARSRYWLITFKGTLKEKSGSGKWVKVDNNKGQCSGNVNMVRVKESS